MKKLFYSAFVASMMLMASSCSQEAEVVDNPVSGEETQSVTFTIETGAVESRTAGDGKSVDQLHYEVWTNDNKLVISSIDGRKPSVAYEAVKVIDGKATVKLNLVRNVKYDIAFWAQMKNGNPYQITDGLDKITYANINDLKANQESYDAFYQSIDDFMVGKGSQTVTLKRPFAQINVGTTEKDYEDAIKLGVNIQMSEVTVTGVKTTFNALTRVASNAAEKLTFKLNDILQETFQIKNKENTGYDPQEYQFLGMNYLFADGTEVDNEATTDNEAKSLHTLTIDLNTDETTTINTLVVNNMPMQRNWRTNIVGQLLTGDEEFQIIVDPEFDGEYNTHIWDGESIHKPQQDAEGNWVITTAAELAWISKASNEGLDAANVLGRAATGHNFAGETIKLAYDIDLNGKEWTPIATFNGIFDGQGHTISNVTIATASNNKVRGFFNTVNGGTIKNLTLNNVKVDAGEGEYAFAGALVGESYGTFKLENVKVQNSEVKGTNKVGGMVGFVREDKIIAENCHVINTNVETHNVTNESGLAGGFIGYIGCAEGKIKNSEISNCSVEGGIFTFINSTNSNKRSNGKFIGGIGGDAGEKITLTNCSATDITYNETGVTDYVSNCGELVGGCRGNFLLIVDGYQLYTSMPEEIELNNNKIMLAHLTADHGIEISGTGTVVLDAITIEAAEGTAITLADGANVALKIVNEVNLTGATNGIFVPDNAKLKIIGDGHLAVIGNNGTNEGNGGSGISGSVEIDGLSALTAQGWGKGGYGIGSSTAMVKISNTQNIVAQGGYVQPLFVSDTSYGKSEPEGAPAIGGAKIILKEVLITKVDGGSKAAAIGARYWESTDIEIIDSTIEEANGGNASAGIGGSRYASEEKYNVSIKIKNSTVTATGGQFGAGIGAGYDTHCNGQNYTATNYIEIDGTSTITAKGGKYAPGIGTGYHSAYLSGSIAEGATINAEAGDEKFYKSAYSTAQDIGYGVVDPAREFSKANAEVTFTVGGKLIDYPIDYIENEGNATIYSVNGMQWFANEVNVNNNSFEGKTVTLARNIDLVGIDWEPIGQTGATQFMGTFDGNEKTISNLSIDKTEKTGANYSSGLFGWLNNAIVKNLKIVGATVKGNHYVGVIAGYLETSGCTIEACHVTGATVECHFKNDAANGDKAGVIVGYAGNAGVIVKNCTAKDSTVSAGRDAGQIAGAAKEANVTGCSATNVTVTANGEGTGANIRNEVIGRLL